MVIPRKVPLDVDYQRIRQQLADATGLDQESQPSDPVKESGHGQPAVPDDSSTPKSSRKRRAAKRRPKRTAISNRHAIRQLALLALFELDVTNHAFEDVVQRVIADPFLSAGSGQGDQPVDAELDLPLEAITDQRELEQGVRDLVYGVIRFAAPIDETIVAAAPAYPIDRIGTIDRNVLRLGIYEMEYVRAESIADVVNEAVELGKRFGGDSTASFVNAVLRTIGERIRAAEK